MHSIVLVLLEEPARDLNCQKFRASLIKPGSDTEQATGDSYEWVSRPVITSIAAKKRPAPLELTRWGLIGSGFCISQPAQRFVGHGLALPRWMSLLLRNGAYCITRCPVPNKTAAIPQTEVDVRPQQVRRAGRASYWLGCRSTTGLYGCILERIRLVQTWWIRLLMTYIYKAKQWVSDCPIFFVSLSPASKKVCKRRMCIIMPNYAALAGSNQQGPDRWCIHPRCSANQRHVERRITRGRSNNSSVVMTASKEKKKQSSHPKKLVDGSLAFLAIRLDGSWRHYVR